MQRSFATVIILLSILCAHHSYAQGFKLQWGRSLPCKVFATTTDGHGNLYLTGRFRDSVDLDPGPGIAMFRAVSPFDDWFFAKYDVNGNFVLAQTLTTAQVGGIYVDQNEHIYLAGFFSGTVDLQPGPKTSIFNSNGSIDIFVAHYDDGGNYINAFTVGGKDNEMASGIVTDANGNIWITGSFKDTVDFDPRSGVSSLLMADTNAYDVFAAQYTPAGALLRTVELDCKQTPPAPGFITPMISGTMAIDAAGNIYLASQFTGTIKMDPAGSAGSTFTATGSDGFVAKYDSTGKYQWGGQIGDGFPSIAVDAPGNVYLAGSFANAMDADIGPGTAMLYSAKGQNIWMAKLTTAGAYVHARALESTASNYVGNIALNNKGSMYLAGTYIDTLKLDPGGSNGKLIANGGGRFVGGYDTSGTYRRSMTLNGTTIGSIGAVYDTARIWAMGNYVGKVDLDPGADSLMLDANGNNSFFAQYLTTDSSSDTTTHIRSNVIQPYPVKIFSAQHSVIVDLTALDVVAANIQVTDMTGRVIATATHHRNDMLRIQLPDAASQVYAVVVENMGAVTTKKLWVE